MLLGFKTELKVNKQQHLLLAQHAGVARHAWNQGLAICQQVIIHNRTNPDDKIKFPTAIDLHKWLVAAVKSTHPWYYEVSKCAPQYALRHLSDALSQRVFTCDHCGFDCDRDVNAAINLEKEAVRLTVLACGLDSADTFRMKQEEKAGSC